MIVFHRVDPFIALEDGSERMPNVFFRIGTAPASGGFALGRVQLALQIGHRARLGRRSRLPPGDTGANLLQA
jgi:hypothetical protein